MEHITIRSEVPVLKFALHPEYQGVYVLPDAVFSSKDNLQWQKFAFGEDARPRVVHP